MTRKTAGNLVPDGLVTLEQYDALVASDLFADVEKFSDNFISQVGPLIQSYNIRWVADPLHQWSRQWEYLYIISRAKKIAKDATIVDLGAGLSFLPYYLKQKLGLSNITAVDYDKSLKGLYKKVNSKLNDTITFQDGDMRHLDSIASDSVDFAYSVSVLEHTDSYPEVVKEIHRIIKPGGTLSITFDISLDGLDDIPLARALELVETIETVFGVKTGLDLERGLQQPDLVMSGVMAARDKKLIPWKYPALNIVKHLMKHHKPGSLYKNLTFCCVTVTKKAAAKK